MGRIKRADAAGAIYHMFNRGNRRATIFEKEADYEAFERILVDAVAKFDVELFGDRVLSNHWHLLVRPKVDGEMSRFAQWLNLTRSQRYRAHLHAAGKGHLFKGRFRSSPVCTMKSGLCRATKAFQ